MSDTTARSLPLYLYRDMMTYLSRGVENTDWQRPSNVYVKKLNGETYYYLAGSADQNVSPEKSSRISSMVTTSSVFSSKSESSSSEESSVSASHESDSSSSQASSSSTPATSSAQTSASSVAPASTSAPTTSPTPPTNNGGN